MLDTPPTHKKRFLRACCVLVAMDTCSTDNFCLCRVCRLRLSRHHITATMDSNPPAEGGGGKGNVCIAGAKPLGNSALSK